MRSIIQRFQSIKQYLSHDMWVRVSLAGSRKIYFMQIIYLSALRFFRVRCTMCASSLTTVTMISIVPVLALFFSIAKGFGGYQKLHKEVIEPGMEQWFGANEAPELRKAIDYLLFFVEETDLSNLGIVGLITVGYALIRLLGSVEDIFNDLWRINTSRPLVRKISDYLTVAMVVPMALFFTASLSAAAKSYHISNYLTEKFSWWGGQVALLEILLVSILWLTFSFGYFFLPNTKIQYKAAIFGGVIGGSLWMFFHYVHIYLQVGVANYNALYASFSAFPIFMIWVFFSWIAVLVGASCAAAIQTREGYQDYIIRENLSVRDREWVAFRVCYELTKSFVEGNACHTGEILEQRVEESSVAIRTVLGDLKRKLILEETKEGGAVLLRDPRDISIFDVLDAVKGEYRMIEKESPTKELHNAKQEILRRVRMQEEVQLTPQDSIWMDSASLHLEECGWIEIRDKKIKASFRLRIHDKLQMIQKQIEENTNQFSLYSLYEQLSNSLYTASLAEEEAR